MQVPFVNLRKQYQALKKELDSAIDQVMEGGQYIGGETVSGFEKAMADFHRVDHFIACASGSDALFLALKALNIGEGDEVITTAFSWIATATAISQTGATPIFVDIELDHFQIDLHKAEEHITDRTKAIVPVYLYGDVTRREAMIAFAENHQLSLIEDAAQVHGLPLPIRGNPHNHLVCTSYYPTKQHGAYGDAGGLWTDDPSMAEKIRRLANHGALFPAQDYVIDGINSRLDPVQASLLRAKLDYLESWLVRRFEIAELYTSYLSDVESIGLPIVGDMHTLYQYVIRVNDRGPLINHLEKEEIGTGLHYGYTLPGTKVYGERTGYLNAEYMSLHGLSLPMYPELTDEEVEYVCHGIKAYFSRCVGL